MKKLTDFNSIELSRIMNKLGEEKRIFNKEAQFQFELAWRIREQFECEVKLEELSCVEEKSNDKIKKKKCYTDIILEKEDFRIAIELKYKTARYKDEENNILLTDHGAVDLGCYDFLWDVNRIQMLIEKDEKSVIKKCNRGYAVILTNENKYWKEQIEKGNKNIYCEFLIGPDKGCLTCGDHQWHKIDGKVGTPTTVKGKFREQKIHLNKDYNFQWQDYCLAKEKERNKLFKYMIIEVK